MRCAIVSDIESSGGAAVAATRLAMGLERATHTVVRIPLMPSIKPTTRDRVVPALPSRSFSERLAGKALSFLRLGHGHQRRMAERLRTVVDSQQADVVNVHNVHGGVVQGQWPHDLVRYLSGRPVVWTLHDTWSFTGRCAYTGDCRRFETQCTAACPTTDEYPRLAPTDVPMAYDAKVQALQEMDDAVAVAPSRWLAEEAARSAAWRNHRIEVISNGVPTGMFRPLDPGACKRILELDATRPAILVVAENLEDRRKGLDLLIGALKTLESERIQVVLMGNAERLGDTLGAMDVRGLGFISDDLTKAIAYSAADALVHPAREDNLPNVVLEAMACGTPTIAFNTGGLPEMVRPGQTGYLAREIGVEPLVQAMREAIDDEFGGQAMRGTCREVALEEYPLQRQAERYARLFEDLIS